MCSFCSASVSSVASASSGLAVATVPRGKPCSSGATACVRAGLCPARVPDGLAGLNAPDRFVARHRLGEAQARRLVEAFVAGEEEGPVGTMGPPIDPPNWLSSSCCFLSSYLLAESSASLRK